MNDLKFAITMELDGEKYYRQQAEINKNNSLYTVCLMLANDEKNHARFLTDTLNKKFYQLVDTTTLSTAKNIFQGMSDIQIAGKEIASQLDFYRIALEKEKQSIDFYTKYYAKAEGAKEKELFEYLIRQEKQHFEVLNELVSLLSHAEEWVENAEFGIRKEY
ncbi:ferritin family protein [Dehalobacter sp. DCM]|uniref:ferritin-like domain-containing protein n=1 Tax=Dehalobacter sp. DCM TaxID=2907827 RepID=UPI003081A450|nr:ferritin family protein [Dehalobacter sp. DCM]